MATRKTKRLHLPRAVELKIGMLADAFAETLREGFADLAKRVRSEDLTPGDARRLMRIEAEKAKSGFTCKEEDDGLDYMVIGVMDLSPYELMERDTTSLGDDEAHESTQPRRA